MLDEDGAGVITEVSSLEYVKVEIHDFTYEYHVSELLKVVDNNQIIHKASDKSFDHLSKKNPEKGSNQVLQHIPREIFDKISKAGYPEIDLHIYELVDKPQQLSNSEMLQIQSFRLEQFIQNCMVSRVTEFVVIHGVGEGVLKLEVQKILNSHGNMEFSDANYGEYGMGATHVKVRGLFK